MTTTYRYPNFQYWPFPVSDEEKQSPEKIVKIKFLENAYSEGFEAYREPPDKLDYYVACSKSRTGCIVQRGIRNRWEFTLSEYIETRFTAYVTEFRIAGEAVRAWLNGGTVNEIFDNIKDHLAVLSGAQSSYKVYEVEQYWPFPISEEEKQSPEAMEKIDFLERIYSEGFEAYRKSQDEVRYTAKSQVRLGHISAWKWGPCWRIELFDYDNDQKLTAFVAEFRVAASAVRACLNRLPLHEILEDIKEHLIVPPKLKWSYKLEPEPDES
jgi:hypothetical protein